MGKELHYEYAQYPPAETAFKCLVNRLDLQVREEDMGGGLRAVNETRSLVVHLQTRATQRGGLKVEVHIRVSRDDDMAAVMACFGEPQKERKMAPTAKDFANHVIALEVGEDSDAFVAEICEQLDITVDQFGNYRAMVLSTSTLPGASKELKQAAKKLKTL
ncbi:MAG: hypothetical protein ACFE89_10000 [Candidatus Hodarchaeota archaeon]